MGILWRQQNNLQILKITTSQIMFINKKSFISFETNSQNWYDMLSKFANENTLNLEKLTQHLLSKAKITCHEVWEIVLDCKIIPQLEPGGFIESEYDATIRNNARLVDSKEPFAAVTRPEVILHCLLFYLYKLEAF